MGEWIYSKHCPGTTTKQQNLDLAPLIEDRPEISHKPQFCQEAQNDPFDKGLLAEQMVKDMLPAIESKAAVVLSTI